MSRKKIFRNGITGLLHEDLKTLTYAISFNEYEINNRLEFCQKTLNELSNDANTICRECDGSPIFCCECNTARLRKSLFELALENIKAYQYTVSIYNLENIISQKPRSAQTIINHLMRHKEQVKTEEERKKRACETLLELNVAKVLINIICDYGVVVVLST